MMTDDARVVEISATDTHDLRRRVLRVGTPSDELAWPGDDAPTTFHLGVLVGDLPVAISTWLRITSPDVQAPDAVGFQLRGMATDPDPASRGIGLGARLLTAGIALVSERGADHAWANARVAVLGFYERHGFDVVGDEFLSDATAIAHRRILRRLG